PGYQPEQDLFIAETGNSFVGYMDINAELPIGRVILDCWVHPEHRRRGIATRLLNSSMSRAKQMGAEIAHINILESNKVAQLALPRLGFNYVRRFLELRLDMEKTRWPDMEQSPLQYRHLKQGEEELLTAVQNSSFTGTWGFSPNTLADIVFRLNIGSRSPEDVVLAYDGDNAIGYCWTETASDLTSNTARDMGRISMIGIVPAYQGRGFGKWVLMGGLAQLKKRGLPAIELTVDSQNKAACSLYKSAGFKVRTGSFWYEKPVN
ncbi:MAG: GNAT family N-acetyltransferase, partial [Dehalococcoidales bacterium]